MQRLLSVDTLVVSQKKEWGEIFSGFETRNKYLVTDSSGWQLYMAVEEGGSMLLKIFLKALRPFEMTIITFNGQPILRLKRPFRFYFHQLNVFDSQGNQLGEIQKRFSLFHRLYSVRDSSGEEMFQLFGPILHPWTFEIRKNNREYGKITKRWSGLLKESFTDADNFGVTFPIEWDITWKALFMGAVFLIDFVHFENKGKR